jgi:hypothetical protein
MRGDRAVDDTQHLCDRLVYIPQYGGAVSLNINVAGGIVLSHFAHWAGFFETPMDGRKFRHTENEQVTKFKSGCGR